MPVANGTALFPEGLSSSLRAGRSAASLEGGGSSQRRDGEVSASTRRYFIFVGA